ncbi:DNA cytosine methyltransferase [Zoogloea ramigera]|uniref:DNA cytosine methyltransferase n=1 Tax=Zoogloea ramigera TaxID=350 RepID=UPI003FA1BCEE
MLLSLFCGAGGLDLGFEQAGFDIALAFDIRNDSINSYNHNRAALGASVGQCMDIRALTLDKLDEFYGGEFRPNGIIGGPPCQSFSRANKTRNDDDPRHELPFVYAKLISDLNHRNPVPFFAFENVTGLNEEPHRQRYQSLLSELDQAGFAVTESILNATQFGVPQNRVRVILVGLNKELFDGAKWSPPLAMAVPKKKLTVRHAIASLPEATYYRRGISKTDIQHHPNHWCMVPKSIKFVTPGALGVEKNGNRSFKTLHWDRPSLTVAYGNREVHVHPNRHRRLSVYEAMILQGFPEHYELLGSLSSQITQVSEAVPPPMAKAIAQSIRSQISSLGIAKTLMIDNRSVAIA